MKSSEIRQAFLNYFSQHGHQVVSSSPLVPGNDPTLLFTNAGMVQFKETFLGQELRPYLRAASSQRCVRAGGKHNDLENVGYTARHHTFFEMLGNFSFGDYFKREAIHYAWDFLTKILGLPAEKLWVTVFEDDDEAADIWLKEMGVSAERFSRCGEKDNFWSMGDTGPCGPCTEIFYDHGPEIAGGPPGSADADGDRYIEIWNLVFMQFNRDKEGHLHPLPKPSVDTGMGLERIAAVVQGVHTNYEIDTFKHLTQAIVRLGEDVEPSSASVNVIADHIRACAFLIVDGVLPGNEGRSYVLRRIIRRAIRHGNKLNLVSPFFDQLVVPLIEVMGEAYPELCAQQSVIERVLKQEEAQFGRTIDMGLRLLEDAILALSGKEIPGDVTFKLYDTYGFPPDLTADIARERGLTLDMQGFEAQMALQRAKSQSANQFEVDYHVKTAIDVVSDFCGYDLDELTADISLLLVDGLPVTLISAGMKAAVVLNKTPFYAQSGGQVGDQGQLLTIDALFQVEDTQKSADAIVHYGTLLKGELKTHQAVTAHVDLARRNDIRLNHTATHLLHAALREIVGSHVQQKGSLVDSDRARFDYSHFAPLSREQVLSIEAWVNDKIRRNTAVITDVMSYSDAQNSGAMALFGEKYTDNVRVLSMGDFSKELCGGTHARRTGDIALFKIIAEYGVASGVRRIEMRTGRHALEWVNAQLQTLDTLALELKTTSEHLYQKFLQVLNDARQTEKELQRLQAKSAEQSGQGLLSQVQQVGDIQLLVASLENTDGQTLRKTLDQLKSRLEKSVIVLYTVSDDKINVIAGVSKSLLGHVPSALEYVRHLCGKGGGREDMAQGGGKVPADLADKVKAIIGMLAQAAV